MYKVGDKIIIPLTIVEIHGGDLYEMSDGRWYTEEDISEVETILEMMDEAENLHKMKERYG